MEQPIRKRRRRTKKSLNAQQLMVLAGCVIGAVALIVAVCFILLGPGPDAGPDVDPSKPTEKVVLPTLTMGQSYRQGQSVVVETSYLDVAYPYAFSDLIFMEAINAEEAAALEFRVKTSTMDEVLYTIWFGKETGEIIGSYKGIPVTVEFFSLPGDLSEDDRGTFKATQETFNDVLQSMYSDENFS